MDEAFISGLAVVCAILLIIPVLNFSTILKWIIIFLFMFTLPGLALIKAFYKSVQGIEVLTFPLSLTACPLTILLIAANGLLIKDQAILAIFLFIIGAAMLSMLRKALETPKLRVNLLKFTSNLIPLYAMLAFIIVIGMASFFYLYSNAISSDVDMWFVLELVDGGLLRNYTSLWHYLGLAPYSYPILFHLSSGIAKVIGELKPSELFLINLIPSLTTILILYFLTEEAYGEKSATFSAFTLCTTPIFIFEALPNTFKAKGMFYALTLAELYIIQKIFQGKKSLTPLLIVFASASLLTYRESLLVNPLIFLTLLAALLMQKSKRLKAFGVGGTMVTALFFAFGYMTYTPSYGLMKTVLSTLAKEGPLLLLFIPGTYYALKRGKPIDFILVTIATVGFAVALFNWKAADSIPIFLAPLSGFGAAKILKHIKEVKKLKASILGFILLGVLSTSFGLSYYPKKYYLNVEPQVFDEIEQIRKFLSSRIQKGALIYGTGYTGIALQKAYASIIVIGPEQQPLAYAYTLHYLISTNFDPWIIKHPETLYGSTFQLYRSILSQNGEALKQFLKTYFIQYLILERSEETERWAHYNNQYLKLCLSTTHYNVYESIASESEINLLRFVEKEIPENEKVIAPWYASPFIHELRRDILGDDLKSALNFNYIHLYERIKGGTPKANEMEDLKTTVETLEKIYEDPAYAFKFAHENGYKYIIVDRAHKSLRLEHYGELIYSNPDYQIFKIPSANNHPPSTPQTKKPEENPSLIVNLYETESFTETRYSLTHPLGNTTVKLLSDGSLVAMSRTDLSGTTIFQVPEGNYTILIQLDDLKIERQVTVSSYTFAPILAPKKAHNPMESIAIPYLLSICLIPLIIASLSNKKGKEATTQNEENSHNP